MERIKEIFEITKGKKAQECIKESGYRYIQIEDLRSDDEIKYCEELSTNVLCSSKDILIAWDGSERRNHWLRCRGGYRQYNCKIINR